MRHFFITSFERLMNVMVVLTGLAILALAGKMAMAAQGDTEALVHAALVLLGGFVALISFAGSAYLAIANHKTLRRMATLVETGGRAAKPLTASRSRELPARRVVQPLDDAGAFDDDEGPAPLPAPVRHAPAMRATAKEAPAAAHPQPVAKPAFARQPPVMHTQAAPQPASRPYAQPPRAPRPEAEVDTGYEDGFDAAPATAGHSPHSDEPPVQPVTPAYQSAAMPTPRSQPEIRQPEPTAPQEPEYRPDALPRSAVFSGRGMPKLRTPASEAQSAAPAPSPVFSQPALGAYPRAHAQQAAAQEQPAAAQSGPSASPQKSGRLVADRRPLR